LPLANRVHDFHPCNRTPGRPKGFEAEHGVQEAFHASVILFQEVVKVLLLNR